MDPLASPEYSEDYLPDGEHLKKEYVDLWADELGARFGSENLTKSQLRAFFGYAKRLQTIHRATRDFEEIKIKLIEMSDKAHLRFERRKAIPESFRNFIQINARKATASPKAFDAFVRHFEAVVCFCEGRLRKD